MNPKEKIIHDLKFAFWDRPINENDLFEAITNEQNEQYPIEKHRLFSRLLVSIEWHQLLKIVPHNKWCDMLSEKTISLIWPKSLQKKFTYAASILLK